MLVAMAAVTSALPLAALPCPARQHVQRTVTRGTGNAARVPSATASSSSRGRRGRHVNPAPAAAASAGAPAAAQEAPTVEAVSSSLSPSHTLTTPPAPLRLSAAENMDRVQLWYS
jgi:hypothetical protein